jgi:hypothetical protein
MQSFFIVLTCKKEDFTGRLSCTYDRPYRLSGDWEAALISLEFTRGDSQYVTCDLVDYCNVNNTKVQLLDYFEAKGQRNVYPRYVKVIRKRFSSINVDIKSRLDSESNTSEKDITCVLHFRKA